MKAENGVLTLGARPEPLAIERSESGESLRVLE